MKFKNLVSIILIISVILLFSACGGEKGNEATTSTDTVSTSSTLEQNFVFDKPEQYLTLGQSVTLNLSGASSDVKFETDDMSILSVSGKSVTVTPKTPDEITIKATDGGKTATATVKAFKNANETIDSKSELIKIFGRTEILSNGRTRFSNTGNGFEVSFYGKILIAEVAVERGVGEICVVTDGDWENAKIINLKTEAPGGKFIVAKYNQPEFHTIKVLKTKEESLEIFNFNSLKVTGGGFVPVKTKYDLKIEAFGDSITCGYGNMRAEGAEDNKELQNGLYTYAAITARELNAEYSAVCRSGIGLYTHRATFKRVMKDILDYVSTESEAKWQTDDAPDVVIINLGTNDSWTGQDYGQYKKYDRNDFKAAYISFIEKIGEKYGKDTLIVCCSGMMETAIKNPIAEAVSEMSGKGYNVKEANFSKTPKGHPTKSYHERYAKKLTEDIKTWLGK